VKAGIAPVSDEGFSSWPLLCFAAAISSFWRRQSFFAPETNPCGAWWGKYFNSLHPDVNLLFLRGNGG
jgi:hypothetical protein